MIIQLKPIPENVLGFACSKETSADHFHVYMKQAIAAFTAAHQPLNLLLSLDTTSQYVKIAGWLQEIFTQLCNTQEVHRIALLAEAGKIKVMQEFFKLPVVVDLRVYGHDDIRSAVHWLETGLGE